MSDAIGRQVGGDHYRRLSPEPWEVMDSWDQDHFVGFLRYSALKRIARWDSKDGALKDIRKAIHELQRLEEILAERESATKPSEARRAPERAYQVPLPLSVAENAATGSEGREKGTGERDHMGQTRNSAEKRPEHTASRGIDPWMGDVYV